MMIGMLADMSKYAKIGWHLKEEGSDRIRLTFEEIEDLLGFRLPGSARDHRPWWANDITHAQAKNGWMRYGWRVCSIDMGEEWVEFMREDDGVTAEEQKSSTKISPYAFEDIARVAMTKLFDSSLFPAKVGNVEKKFDFVSEDESIVGDAKYYCMVNGQSIPPAKFSTIAEHVWLLENTKAKVKFLVFGNDRRVPEKWLEKYGNLVKSVDFYFLDVEEGTLEELKVVIRVGTSYS